MTPKEIAKEWRRMQIGLEVCHAYELEARADELHAFIAEHEDEILAALDAQEADS